MLEKRLRSSLVKAHFMRRTSSNRPPQALDTPWSSGQSDPTNQTTYQFGYLYMADTLCYWNRELAQVKNQLGDASVIPPACVF